MATTNQPAGELTLTELVESLPDLLASGYGGVRNGRVRDLPDARTVRWYQTLGMVDRPAAFRGRTALYGRRHLLQLAAIKKLQSSGFPLSDIQRGLAGKNDGELARSAGVSRRDVDRIIERAVLTRSKSAASTLAAALAGTPAVTNRRATPFWKEMPSVIAKPAPVSSVPQGMQSMSLGEAGVLLWNGRELTATEQATLAELVGPAAMFLHSIRSSAAVDAPAEGISRAASSPPRPEKGARP